MSDSHSFTDVSAGTPRKQHFWPTLIVPRAAIEAEIERLASIDRPASGRRASAISHPSNTGPVPAFAPGIDVTIEVLKPGEESLPVSRNSTMVDMCIRGAGTARIGAQGVRRRALRRLEHAVDGAVPLPQRRQRPVRAHVVQQRAAAREARGALRRHEARR